MDRHVFMFLSIVMLGCTLAFADNGDGVPDWCHEEPCSNWVCIATTNCVNKYDK